MKKNKRIFGEYDYEENPEKKKPYRSPDDMLKTLPGPSPASHRRGVVAFAVGLVACLSAVIPSVYIWFGCLALSGVGLSFAVLQRKIKKTGISLAAIFINIAGAVIFLIFIILYFAGLLRLTN